MKVILVNGWGFDRLIWGNILRKLPQFSIQIVDLGFTGNVYHNVDFDNAICIGHSLGVMWLLDKIKNPAALISINGFPCFYKYVDNSQISHMKKNLEANLSRQMKSFYYACGASYTKEITSKFIMPKLQEGLNWLKTWDKTSNLKNLSCPIVAIASMNDKIVSKEMTIRCWGDDVVWSETGGHILPITNSQLCVNQIMRVNNELYTQKQNNQGIY